jgi:hypothetical protein
MGLPWGKGSQAALAPGFKTIAMSAQVTMVATRNRMWFLVTMDIESERAKTLVGLVVKSVAELESDILLV